MNINQSSSGGTSRRGFLVCIASTVLGIYMLPRLDGSEILDDAVRLATESEAEASPPVRKLITLPRKIHNAKYPEFTSLSWGELSGSGKIKVMVWLPENEEDSIEALRFYNDSRDRPIATPVTPIPRRSRQEKELIDACLDDLASEKPRLAYARWLENQGSTYGEFVRKFLEKQEGYFELVQNHAKEWFQPLTSLGLSFDFMGTFAPWGWL